MAGQNIYTVKSFNVVLNLSQPDLENDKLRAAEMEKSSRSSDTTGLGQLRLP